MRLKLKELRKIIDETLSEIDYRAQTLGSSPSPAASRSSSSSSDRVLSTPPEDIPSSATAAEAALNIINSNTVTKEDLLTLHLYASGENSPPLPISPDNLIKLREKLSAVANERVSVTGMANASQRAQLVINRSLGSQGRRPPPSQVARIAPEEER